MTKYLMLLFYLLLITLLFINIKKHPSKELPKDTKAIRGLLCLTVVLGHASLYTNYSKLLSPLFALAACSNGVFFFLSSYGLHKKNLTTEDYSKGFLIKRVTKILIPYLLITTLVFIFSKYLYQEPYTIKYLIDGFLLGEPIIPFSWFIITIFFFYIEYYFLMKLLKKNSKLIIFETTLIHIFYCIMCIRMKFEYWWFYYSYLLIIGIIWATYEKKLSYILKKHPKIVILSTSLLLLAMLIIQFFVSYPIYKISLIFGVFLLMILTITILYNYDISNKITNFLGTISFEIYLFHGIIILLLDNSLIKNDFIFLLTVLLCTIIISTIFHFLYCKINDIIKK